MAKYTFDKVCKSLKISADPLNQFN